MTENLAGRGEGLAGRIEEIVCRGKHKRGGPACQASCGIQVQMILAALDTFCPSLVQGNFSGEEVSGILRGLAEVAAGRVKSLEQIKAELAATQKPAGSGAKTDLELARGVRAHVLNDWQGERVEREVIKALEIVRAETVATVLKSGSPRKVGEDGPLKYGDVVWVPATVIRVFEQQLNVGIHRLGPSQHSYYAVLDKNEIVRPSSVPVGEQKQEESRG